MAHHSVEVVSVRVKDLVQGKNPDIPLTSRPMRADEEDGRDYHFVTFDQFRDLIRVPDVLGSYGILNDNYYGEFKLDHHTKARRPTLAMALGKPVEVEEEEAEAASTAVRFHSGQDFKFEHVEMTAEETADAEAVAAASDAAVNEAIEAGRILAVQLMGDGNSSSVTVGSGLVPPKASGATPWLTGPTYDMTAFV